MLMHEGEAQSRYCGSPLSTSARSRDVKP